jgi:hypothetical protein
MFARKNFVSGSSQPHSMSFLAGSACAEAVQAKWEKSDTKMAQSKTGHLVLLLGKPVGYLSGCMTVFFFRGRGVDLHYLTSIRCSSNYFLRPFSSGSGQAVTA